MTEVKAVDFDSFSFSFFGLLVLSLFSLFGSSVVVVIFFIIGFLRKKLVEKVLEGSICLLKNSGRSCLFVLEIEGSSLFLKRKKFVLLEFLKK